MPSFHVVDSLALDATSLFVLVGAVTAGTITSGMVVRIPFNGSVAMTAPIHSIEFLRRDGGREETALCIRCRDAEELGLWRGLKIRDETIEVLVASERCAT